MNEEKKPKTSLLKLAIIVFIIVWTTIAYAYESFIFDWLVEHRFFS